MTEFAHTPVLLKEVLEALRIRPDGIYLDGTAGGGGHSYEIAKRLGPEGRLICLDQDEAAVKTASARLETYGDRVEVVRSNYRNFEEVLNDRGIEKADGILLDLGVSSYQLDAPERGFSYLTEAKLDMRMDQRAPLDAKRVVNEYSEQELYRIIRDYGEDRFAKNIAKHICLARQEKEIDTTTELAGIVKRAIPMKVAKTGGHPAMRTFQALRIEVNQELSVLSDSLERMIDRLRPGGILAVITFHSLEDRIVKNIFKTSENPCTCPPEFPVCVCGKKPKGRVVTRKAIAPTAEELKNNRRSASAKLRVFEKY